MLHVPTPLAPEAGAHPLAAALAGSAAVLSISAMAPGWLRLDRLASDEAALQHMLDMQVRPAAADARTRAAFLVHRYAWRVATAILPLYLADGLVPDIAPDRVAIEAASEVAVPKLRLLHCRFLTARPEFAGHPDARLLADAGLLRTAFRRMLESHFEPLIACLHARAGLSRSAMWRLVGDSIAAVFLDVGRNLGDEETAKAEALALLKVPGSPLDNRQLHFFEVAPAGTAGRAATFRARGGCCRYYKVEGGELCATCVLETPANRERRLSEWLRTQAGATVS